MLCGCGSKREEIGETGRKALTCWLGVKACHSMAAEKHASLLTRANAWTFRSWSTAARMRKLQKPVCEISISSTGRLSRAVLRRRLPMSSGDVAAYTARAAAGRAEHPDSGWGEERGSSLCACPLQKHPLTPSWRKRGKPVQAEAAEGVGKARQRIKDWVVTVTEVRKRKRDAWLERGMWGRSEWEARMAGI